MCVIATMLRIHAVGLLLCGIAYAAPTPLPAPDIDFQAGGEVHAIARQPDGGVVIGGSFITVDGIARRNLARFRPDGTLDTAWEASTNGVVNAITVDGDGTLFVGGYFTQVAGEVREGLAKLAADGSLDPAWNPGGRSIEALALDGNGSLYVGGSFSNIGGAPAYRIARLAATGTGAVDTDWTPSPGTSASARVSALAVDGAAIYVGGTFDTIGGAARHNLAKLSTSVPALADPSWQADVADSLLTPNIGTLGLDGSGSLYVGGTFDHVAGAVRSNIARVSTATGAIDPGWNPSADNTVRAVVVDGNAVYAGGGFAHIGGLVRARIARLSTVDGNAAADWNPSANGSVLALLANASGGAIAGGTFDRIGGQDHLGFATVDATGAVIRAAEVENPPIVRALARTHAGDVVVGGAFARADGLRRTALLRLKPDGSIDTDWHPEIDGSVFALAVDSADDVFILGSFTSAGGFARQGIAKIDSAGAVDASWNTSRSGPLSSALAIDEADYVYLGGFPPVRIPAAGNGDPDPAWSVEPDNLVRTLVVDGAGSVYIGGYFTSVNGVPRNHLAKVSTSTPAVVDPDWNPDADLFVTNLSRGTDDRLYVSGYFETIGGVPRSHLARVAASGTGAVDATWAPALLSTTMPAWQVYAVQEIGREVFVAGQFDTADGMPNGGFVALDVADAAVAPALTPAFDAEVVAILPQGPSSLVAGGDFGHVGNAVRKGVAAFDFEAIFADGFD